MPHRVFLTRLLVAASLALLTAGCGGGGATGDIDKIQVELSQFDITVTNTSGGPLTDVVAEIAPAGPGSHFAARIGTLANTERRSISHGGFSDRDSVPFSLRNAKPTRIIVAGNGVDGKPVRVDVPFKLQ
jgi:hypothetical protein